MYYRNKLVKPRLAWLIFLICAFYFTCTKAEPIHVVTEYLTPYQLKKADGSLGGFSTEVVNELFKLTGDTANIQIMPWARAYTTALNQKNTLIYSIARTKTREPLFNWVGSLTTERLYFWGLKSKFEHKVNSIEQLKTKRIAASRKSNAEQYLRANNFKRIFPLVIEDQTMQMLYRDRVDLIIGTEQTFKALTTKLSLPFDKIIKVIEIPDLNVDLSIAFSLDTSPDILQRFIKAHQQLAASGKLAEIQNKWQIPTN